jgi:RHS repeat-associated protein
VVLNYGYDAFDGRTSLSVSVAGSVDSSVSYGYDLDHQLTSANMVVNHFPHNIQGPIVNLAYDAANRLTSVTGSLGGTSTITGSYGYDAADRITSISYTSSVAGSLESFTYGYDAADQLTSYSGPDGSLNYGYDAASELTSVTGAHSESYGYDLNGNRNTTGYTTGTGNRLTTDGTYNYTYDNEGNLLTQTRISDGQVTALTWDYRNRLTEVTVKTSGGTLLQDDKFTYDVEDRRIGKSTLASGQTWTSYDGQNPYADFNSSGSLTARYLYGLNVDQLFAKMNSSNTTTWYLRDLNNSVRELVNTNGTMLDQLTYDSFGNILSETSPSNGDRFKYTSREWDSEVGLYLYRARYYIPGIGRFLSEDPSGFGGQDPNLYRYVGNYPVEDADPSGLCPWLRRRRGGCSSPSVEPAAATGGPSTSYYQKPDQQDIKPRGTKPFILVPPGGGLGAEVLPRKSFRKTYSGPAVGFPPEAIPRIFKRLFRPFVGYRPPVVPGLGPVWPELPPRESMEKP